MGSIIGRTRKDSAAAYLAQILLKRKGQIIHHRDLAERPAELEPLTTVERAKQTVHEQLWNAE